MKVKDWVTFEGAGVVEEVYDDAYSEGAGNPTRGVRIRVRLSDRPGHDFMVYVPIVCVALAEQRDKLSKGGQ